MGGVFLRREWLGVVGLERMRKSEMGRVGVTGIRISRAMGGVGGILEYRRTGRGGVADGLLLILAINISVLFLSTANVVFASIIITETYISPISYFFRRLGQKHLSDIHNHPALLNKLKELHKCLHNLCELTLPKILFLESAVPSFKDLQ